MIFLRIKSKEVADKLESALASVGLTYKNIGSYADNRYEIIEVPLALRQAQIMPANPWAGYGDDSFLDLLP
jgi:hypothetical protein